MSSEDNALLTEEAKAAVKELAMSCIEGYLFSVTGSWDAEIVELRKKRNELTGKVARLRDDVKALKAHVGYEPAE